MLIFPQQRVGIVVLSGSISPIFIVVSGTLTIFWYETGVLNATRLRNHACRVTDCYVMFEQLRVDMSGRAGYFFTPNRDSSSAISVAILKNEG